MDAPEINEDKVLGFLFYVVHVFVTGTPVWFSKGVVPHCVRSAMLGDIHVAEGYVHQLGMLYTTGRCGCAENVYMEIKRTTTIVQM